MKGERRLWTARAATARSRYRPLDVMTGEELRSFVGDILAGPDEELRSAHLDSVIACAANSFVVVRRSKGVVSHCRNSTRPNSRSVGPPLAVNATLRPYIRS